MRDTEMLAIAQAIFKGVSEIVSTKDPDSLRSRVDRMYAAMYEDTGAKSFDVQVDGQNVGTYSLKFSKPTDGYEEEVFYVADYLKLADWASKVPERDIREYIASHLKAFAQWTFDATGEIADGCDIETVVTPAEEPHIIGSTLKIDTEAVIKAASLPPSVAGLLRDGND